MIVLDGVTFDLVVQRDGRDWIVGDSDGLIFSRHETRLAAERSMRFRQASLVAQGGQVVFARETQKTKNGTV
jgi:regulator of RNase E activity RraA